MILILYDSYADLEINQTTGATCCCSKITKALKIRTVSYKIIITIPIGKVYF